MNKQTELVLNYHNRTKHSFDRYANGPSHIDWADQPDQFRRFSGCEVVNLPEPGADPGTLFNHLDAPEIISVQPLSLSSIGLLMELAFGLSAWKQFGSNRWALRCNPSSGNLHPTETYLIALGLPDLPAGVYHYVSHDHSLERRCSFDPTTCGSKPAEIFVALSSIHWREAWKYGERAYRYCQHDTGHALGALQYAAATLGWSVEMLTEWADQDIAELTGINRIDDFIALEAEAADLICRIRVNTDLSQIVTPEELLHCARSGTWFGTADSLGAYHHYDWPIIDEVAAAAAKPVTPVAPQWNGPPALLYPSSYTASAAQIIRQRRSAQHFNAGMSPLALAKFGRILNAVLPGNSAFTIWPWPPKVQLFIFVHRVADLEPGLYALIRSESALPKLRAAMQTDFSWEKVEIPGAPSPTDLPFYRLISGDCRRIAMAVSCHQDIAGDSAFSLGMVAEFADTLTDAPWAYRRLFWECGLIGQVLYLEAEAAGIRGTGIGCYFDDSMHQILGLQDQQYQSLYHFTIGRPLDDSRLQTLPAYAHLQQR